MNELCFQVLNWIKQDWKSNPYRCALEILAWALSIICSFVMMLTVPNPPWLILYPIYVSQCAIFAWSSYTRGSIGLLANYAVLVIIDGIALVKLIILYG